MAVQAGCHLGGINWQAEVTGGEDVLYGDVYSCTCRAHFPPPTAPGALFRSTVDVCVNVGVRTCVRIGHTPIRTR